MKKLIILVIIALIINTGCNPGYVATEPEYIEIQKSTPPSPSYIWVDNGWVYNHTTKTYVRADGVWIQPKEGRSFIPGKWESSKKGYYWKKGKWKKVN